MMMVPVTAMPKETVVGETPSSCAATATDTLGSSRRRCSSKFPGGLSDILLTKVPAAIRCRRAMSSRPAQRA
jgi:hypothetical protein